MREISYGLDSDFRGVGPPDFFQSLLSQYACTRVLEVGSGANPMLDPGYVRAHRLVYFTNDIDPKELEKADPSFERLALDLTARDIDPAVLGSFDAIISRMVGEHIPDGRQYHSNIFRMLRPGGISAHSFSTLWAIPFAINRLLPERATDRLLNLFTPRDRHRHEKFKAYYSWGRGPTRLMIQRFQAIGFQVLQYSGYFGHAYYAPRMPWLHRIEMQKARFLLKHPIPQLCSYATVVLRKPEDAPK
jgi:SAM-dependent methyltransferase